MKQVIDLRPAYHRKDERIRAHVLLCWLALLLARVAENACGAHGSAAFSDTHPLKRIWRDCEVAGRHAIANPAIGAEIYGRSLLGINEGVTPLV